MLANPETFTSGGISLKGNIYNYENFLRSNWGNQPLSLMMGTLKVDLYSLLDDALRHGLQDIETSNVRRRWSNEEDKFLSDKSKILTITQAANLLHRSRYATYQRVRYLNLHEMINKK